MSDETKTPPQDTPAQNAADKPLPHGRAATTANARGTETDTEVLRANDYFMSGELHSNNEVTNPNLHYGTRTFVDPELEAGAPATGDGIRGANNGLDIGNSEQSTRGNGGVTDQGASDPAASGQTDANGLTSSDLDASVGPGSGGHDAFASLADGEQPATGTQSTEFEGAAAPGQTTSGGPGGGGPGGDGGTDGNASNLDVDGGAIDENSIGGTVAATLEVPDAQPGETFVYEILGGSPLFEIIGDQIVVRAGADIDFETAPLHNLVIRVTDEDGNFEQSGVTINVNDLIDETPTDIVPSSTSVDENAAAGLVVATLSTVDADANDTHTYTLTNDPSGSFEIVGNEIRVAAGADIDFEAAQSHDVTVQVTDAGGHTYSEVITLSVNDLNEDPTDITLTGGNIDENAAAGTTVATLSAVDQDTADSHTYSITNDPSGLFEIVGNEVRVASGTTVDFETGQSHDVTVEVTDAGGNTYSEVITVTVNDLNEAPSDITFSGGTVDEGEAAGAVVATLNTIDQDAGDSHTYALTNDPSGFFEIVGDEIRVAAGANIDFETDQTHDVTVEVTDAGGNTYSEVITLSVNDLFDEGPSDITLAGGGSVDENAAAGTVAAVLSTVDADAGDSHTYAITNDPSGFFEIVGNEVRLAAGANVDFEASPSHDITVEVTDAGGNTYSEVVTISVNDLNEGPTDITLTGGNIDENSTAGTVVATLAAVDEDAGDSHTYTLTNDPSGLFEIVGDEVRVAAGADIDFETARATT